MTRPPLLYRLRYLWPPNNQRLIHRLRMAVLAGVLTPHAALESYEREARIFPRWMFIGESAYPMISFVMADAVRQVLARPYPQWNRRK